MNDPLLSSLPPKYRNAILVFLALQVIASQLVARVPTAVLRGRFRPVWLMLHWFGHARFLNEPGTVKFPGATVISDEQSARAAFAAWLASFGEGGDADARWLALPSRDRGAWYRVAAAARYPRAVEEGGGDGDGRASHDDGDVDRETVVPNGALRSLARALREGAAAVRSPGGVGAAMMALAFVILAACGPASGIVRSAAGAPPVVGCAPNAVRCGAQGPEVCSPEGAWWPALGHTPGGAVQRCPAGTACEVFGDAQVRCSPADAAVDAGEGGGAR